MSTSVLAQEKPGIVGAPILQIPMGARAVGMGTAVTAALPQDLSAIYYNPASLAMLNYREAGGMFLRGLDDQNIQSLEFGTPLPFAGFLGDGSPTVAASLLFSQNGTIQYNQINSNGSLLSSQSLSAGSDLVGTVSYAERVADTPIETPNQAYYVNHMVGLSAKLIHSSLVQQYSATAVAADVGYLAQLTEWGVTAGASIMNLGTKMTYLDSGDNLPLTGRLGAACQLDRNNSSPQRWTLAADGDYSVYERQWHVNTGVEYFALQSVAARIGYRFHQDIAGLTIGFGVLWNNLSMDYAWAMTSAISDTHRIGITYRFSAAPVRVMEKRKQPYIMESPEEAPLRPARPRQPNQQPQEDPNKAKGSPGWIY